VDLEGDTRDLEGHKVASRTEGSRVTFELPPATVGYAPAVARAGGNVAELVES